MPDLLRDLRTLKRTTRSTTTTTVHIYSPAWTNYVPNPENIADSDVRMTFVVRRSLFDVRRFRQSALRANAYYTQTHIQFNTH